jgi:hypothetical protein
MTGRIIQLGHSEHQRFQLLLPWYRKGGLEPVENGQLAAHLQHCALCQAALREEDALAKAITAVPLDEQTLSVDHGWDQISRMLDAAAQPLEPLEDRRAPVWMSRGGRSIRVSPAWLGWAVAAQFVMLLGLGAVMVHQTQPARYHALSARPADAAGNVIVIFRPETSEQDLRAILRASQARLVDGPTAADAYVLHVDAAARPAVLKALQQQTQVVLAEPVDAGNR